MTDHQGFVCAACVDDPSLKALIESEATNEECSFCGATSDKSIAAPLEELTSYIQSCLYKEYDDPAQCMGYSSADGGYLGETFDSSDLLFQICLELPNDDGTLFEAIASSLSDHLWCRKDPYGMTFNEELSHSWQSFCELIKHKRRFFFLEEGKSDHHLAPAKVLATIFEFAENNGLVITVPQGKNKFFRARYQGPGKNFNNALELGPPPTSAAKQNRMSPAGIVMMYVSEDPRTALDETVYKEGTYVVGEFVTERDANILDLAELPRTPSIFDGISDSLEYDPRINLTFLHEIAYEISRPIARDDRVHVEYVPTQVVTEFLRTVATLNGSHLDGIRYKSSRRDGGTSLVLFADQRDLVVPEEPQDGTYRYHKARWIKLVDKQECEITDLRLDYEVRPFLGGPRLTDLE